MTTQATTPTPEPPATRRLTRSSSDRVIAGVAGGIGRYIGVDAVVIRLTLIVLAFFGGAGLIAYVAAWIIVPSDDGSVTEYRGGEIARRTGVALGVVVLTFVVAAGGATGVAVGGGTATAVIIIAAGVALVAGAFTSGARWLIVPAIALALSASLVAASDIDARGGMGERIYHPVSTSELRDEYRLGVGHLWLDLRDVDFGSGKHRINVKMGVGQAEIIVPPELCVTTTANVSVGSTQVFEREHGGLDHDFADYRTPVAGSPHLVIDGDVGVGQLRVSQYDARRLAAEPGACTNG